MKRLNEASSVTRTGTCSVVEVMMEGAWVQSSTVLSLSNPCGQSTTVFSS